MIHGMPENEESPPVMEVEYIRASTASVASATLLGNDVGQELLESCDNTGQKGGRGIQTFGGHSPSFPWLGGGYQCVA